MVIYQSNFHLIYIQCYIHSFLPKINQNKQCNQLRAYPRFWSDITIYKLLQICYFWWIHHCYHISAPEKKLVLKMTVLVV